MRLIDADALLEQFDIWDDADELFVDSIREEIKHAPTIEPERKTGKWIHTDTQAGYDINGDLVWADMMKCETCGFEICAIQGHIAQYNYCPNCGAFMGEDKT